MASLAVFEDNEMFMFQIETLAAKGEHEIVAQATSITEAHELLTKMALHEVQADYTLLDANLEGYQVQTPDFVFQPLGEQTVTRRNLVGRAKNFVVPLDPIVVKPTGSGIGQHGRQISAVIKACDIPTTVIGISGDSVEKWGGPVDYDLGKQNILPGLLRLIETIEATKER